MLNKPKREQNKEYLAFVRTLPCTICKRHGTDPHHLISRGAGGSDYTAVPLCRTHHVEIHKIGIDSMEAKYGVSWDFEQEWIAQAYFKSVY